MPSVLTTSPVDRAIALSDELQSAEDGDLLRRALELRWRARAGEPVSRLFADAGALVRETSRRKLGMPHYPVQLRGGFEMLRGHVVEMQTGEGKTLTAVLPAFVRALAGKGAHVLTVNDYLVERDAELMSPVFRTLGMTVGTVIADKEPEDRAEAYACDVTYGTAKEMGFDFLRDRLKYGADGTWAGVGTPEGVVQRGHHFALVDEADAILVDEARTPLIIGTQIPNDAAHVALYRWCRRTAEQLTPVEHFEFDPKKRSAELTDPGCRAVLLTPKPPMLSGIDIDRMYEQTEKALVARYGFERDRDYVVAGESGEEIVIVDESTGRQMDGRKWQDGLHQAVEAKERLPITAATGTAAQITMQNFFRLYENLAGMTGTAVQCRAELRRTYSVPVTVIPTHRPCIRVERPTRVFATHAAKAAAIVEETRAMIDIGRPVLIGTPSVEASERLSPFLEEAGIEHRVLNARNHAEEARIVAQAGRVGRVTIATNMAGRGTDIILGGNPEYLAWRELSTKYESKLDVPRHEWDEAEKRVAEREGMTEERAAIRELGGLHVIATEIHSSKRIDRQLVGRGARQGDPGSYRFLVSLEDELFRVLPPKKRESLRRNAHPNADGELPRSWVAVFERTQRLLEKLQRKQRKQLLKQEKQRKLSHRRMGLDPYLELVDA